jgi:tryptophan-rich sensory protein
MGTGVVMDTLAQRPPAPARSALALAAFALAVVAVAALGSVAASSSRETYERLDLPPFAPPGWVFGPVWTVLYVLIAVSGWLVWREVGLDRSIGVYAVQLVLNALWTPIFFAGDRYGLALVEIVVLLAAVVATTVLFRPRSRTAAALLLPYAAWVAFATALNAGIVLAN